MSLIKIAQHIKSEGRGNDTELVHMAPSEVHALQKVAEQHGGSLTINPNTGLPEAGFLESILPAVVGAGATIATGGAISPLLAAGIAGVGTGLLTKDLNKGLMAGLGAFGGASLAGGLMSSGASALAAAPESALAGITPQATAGAVNAYEAALPQLSATEQAAAGIATPSVPAGTLPANYNSPAYAPQSSWDQMQQGFKATKFDADWLKKNAMGIGAIAAPMLMGGDMFSSNPAAAANTQNAGYVRPMTYSQTRNPYYTGAGTAYFNQSMTPQTPVPAGDWGSRSYAEGGIAALGGQNNMYPMSQMDHTQYATPTQMPTSAEVVNAGYEEKIQPYTGEELRMADGGTPQLEMANKYSTPTRAVNPDVAAYNNMLAQRAQQEYIQQAPLAALTPQPLRAATAPTPYTTPVFNTAPVLTGTDQYKALQDQIAALQQQQQPVYDSGSGGAAAGGLMALAAGGAANSKMAAVDQYMAQAQASPDGMKQLMAKAQAGDYNAMLAMNKLQNTPNQNYAGGGGIYDLGGYSDGGRLLKGPGDGVSDDIPASIGHKQPARLADGEFVIPARIVSELGNGSTDAGAKRLYKMMDNVQEARKKSIGKEKVAVDSKSYKHLPA